MKPYWVHDTLLLVNIFVVYFRRLSQSYEGGFIARLCTLSQRCGGLMISGSQLRVELSGFELRLGILCCVLGQNTLLSQYSLKPSEQIGTTKFYVGSNPAKDLHPIQGVVEILLVASCHWDRNVLWHDGPDSLYADLTHVVGGWFCSLFLQYQMNMQQRSLLRS